MGSCSPTSTRNRPNGGGCFPSASSGTPTAALLNRSGQKMSALTVAPAVAGGTHQIELALNTMPAGEYLIEITPPGGADNKELFAVRVTS